MHKASNNSFSVGSKVTIGFIRDLEVVAAYDNGHLLTNKSRSRFYHFTPYNGIYSMSEQEFAKAWLRS